MSPKIKKAQNSITEKLNAIIEDLAKNTALSSFSTSNLPEANLLEDELAPKIQELCMSLTWNEFPYEPTDLAFPLAVAAISAFPNVDLETLDPKEEWRRWWLARIQPLVATLLDNAKRDHTFLRKILTPIFFQHNKDMSENRKIRYENDFRHAYIIRFGELILAELQQRDPKAVNYFSALIPLLVAQTNSNIYDILLCLRTDNNYPGLSYFSRLFDYCSAKNLGFLPDDIENISELIQSITTELNLDDFLAIKLLNLEQIDTSGFWRNWLKKKTEQILDFLATIDTLTGKNYFDIILEEIKTTENILSLRINDILENNINLSITWFKLAQSLAQGFAIFNLGQLRLDVTKQNDAFFIYIGCVTELLGKEFDNDKSDFSKIIKEGVAEKYTPPILNITTSYAQKLHVFVNALLNTAVPQNKNKSNFLLHILQEAYDFLYSAADENKSKNQQRFFIQALLDEQTQREPADDMSYFYNKHEMTFFRVILNEIENKFVKKFYVDLNVSENDEKKFKEITKRFIEIKTLEHQSKALSEIQALFELSADIYDIETRIDDSDLNSCAIHVALDNHFQDLKKEYTSTYVEKRWLSPAEKLQLLNKTTLTQKTFIQENVEIRTAPKLKSLLRRLFEKLTQKLQTIFFSSTSLVETKSKKLENINNIKHPKFVTTTTPVPWLQEDARKFETKFTEIASMHKPFSPKIH